MREENLKNKLRENLIKRKKQKSARKKQQPTDKRIGHAPSPHAGEQ